MRRFEKMAAEVIENIKTVDFLPAFGKMSF
jgi:hypothetical protein